MSENIAAFMNEQELGSLTEGFRREGTPVMATPAAVVAALAGKKVVGAAAAGVTGVGVAYTVGRTVN
ncbi:MULTISPECIES: hypothetical protein [Nesterenkonia]|uniref:Uncharacterized protein n=1 Tax=Nesterenkonia xinjiangensis TaxID=225327 RepID=A0A7Z0KA72_9MICC|nr:MULTISPECIES: hypothetical protein [Nesterenkonia]MDZ5077368.1 hypothetical protein [Nesterenkonia sp. HG001]NYJ77990.1 hypothetical protein [Nesterenkonia xinjiangensis]